MGENKNIVVNQMELLAAKEKAFNEINEISLKHGNNPYMMFQQISNCLGRLYESDYKSGFRQSELNTILNKPE